MKFKPRGQIMVFYALALAALLGVTALCTDVAVMYWNWLSMQKAVDAAALAGANYLPEDPTTASSQAVNYGELNGLTAAEIGSPSIAANLSSITVNAARNVPYYFGRVLGLTQQLVQVSATAAAPSSPSCIGCPPAGSPPPPSTFGTYVGEYGLIPVGLQYDTPYKEGESIQLTQGGTGNNSTWGPGNWGSLALGGQGGSNERSNLANGYSGPVAIGDWVLTEPGQKVGPIDQGVNDRINNGKGKDPSGSFSTHTLDDARAAIVPLVDWNNPNGRSSVQIKGFAMVWLDSASGGVINAHFICQVAPDSVPNTSVADNGVQGVPILIK
jgi:hypothetical protein